MTLCQFGAILMLKKILEFGHLVRFSHSLFAMPFALGAMWVAADGFANYSVSEIIRLVVLIVGCMVFARNGAMTFNRLADEKYDKANPRTANRHLPAKKLNRHFVGIEREKEYVAIAEKRLEMADADKTIQGYEDGVFKLRHS